MSQQFEEVISILGCGNIGLSIAQGLVNSKDFDAKKIILTKRSSMTCLAARSNTSPIGTDEQEAKTNRALQVTDHIFSHLGSCVTLVEEQIVPATALCACGVAFFCRAIRAAAQGGIEIGFHAEDAIRIAAQTAKGAATLLLDGGHHPEFEIDKVTTPQGCTIAGLNQMEHSGFSSAMIKGIVTSAEKAASLYNSKKSKNTSTAPRMAPPPPVVEATVQEPNAHSTLSSSSAPYHPASSEKKSYNEKKSSYKGSGGEEQSPSSYSNYKNDDQQHYNNDKNNNGNGNNNGNSYHGGYSNGNNDRGGFPKRGGRGGRGGGKPFRGDGKPFNEDFHRERFGNDRHQQGDQQGREGGEEPFFQKRRAFKKEAKYQAKTNQTTSSSTTNQTTTTSQPPITTNNNNQEQSTA
ncbi:pyrroline-5-carboxylate reductase [Cavenderia fasciculata]|uniref:Pyrroline-5-carboxylate reductase n=1 Tax=Cavenderia fasciculata TaxID=261658 RepID=F4Q5M4_CACFS|nr:pyrroline-5-carboxylate reductase [Cavenderia fasciculata]EGG17283.1 pyrroline-5-carboxylate reductase [Cavenderia fasciculata]|eukprot:XP_004355767.1 pyrroline-5-carboxylate reductase [Cavenderia fasciculata]